MPKKGILNLDQLNSLNLKEIEDKVITIAMARAGGHRANAAKMLGIHDRTLQHKLKARLDRDKDDRHTNTV